MAQIMSQILKKLSKIIQNYRKIKKKRPILLKK
nr:MAG TPA: hypothetical protein [Caudoviricetes sp.]